MGDAMLWYRRYYEQLAGATITNVAIHPSYSALERLPHRIVMRVKLRDGQLRDVELWSDEEGNGLGFLHGLPRPKPTKERGGA